MKGMKRLEGIEHMGMKLANAAMTLLWLAVAAPAWSLSDGRTARGDAFVMGGNGDNERGQLRQERKRFSLWVQTGASAGDLNADASVRITARDGTVLLETKLLGPWLFVNLGVGEYSVAVTVAGATEMRRAFIHPGDHAEMIFLFDAPAVAMLPGTSR